MLFPFKLYRKHKLASYWRDISPPSLSFKYKKCQNDILIIKSIKSTAHLYRVFLPLLLCLFAGSFNVHDAFFPIHFIYSHWRTEKRVCRNQMIYLHLYAFFSVQTFLFALRLRIIQLLIVFCEILFCMRYVLWPRSFCYFARSLFASIKCRRKNYFAFMSHRSVKLNTFLFLSFPFVISFTLTIIIWRGGLSTLEPRS